MNNIDLCCLWLLWSPFSDTISVTIAVFSIRQTQIQPVLLASAYNDADTYPFEGLKGVVFAPVHSSTEEHKILPRRGSPM